MLNEYYKDDPRPPKLIDENQFLNELNLLSFLRVITNFIF